MYTSLLACFRAALQDLLAGGDLIGLHGRRHALAGQAGEHRLLQQDTSSVSARAIAAATSPAS